MSRSVSVQGRPRPTVVARAIRLLRARSLELHTLGACQLDLAAASLLASTSWTSRWIRACKPGHAGHMFVDHVSRRLPIGLAAGCWLLERRCAPRHKNSLAGGLFRAPRKGHVQLPTHGATRLSGHLSVVI